METEEYTIYFYGKITIDAKSKENALELLQDKKISDAQINIQDCFKGK